MKIDLGKETLVHRCGVYCYNTDSYSSIKDSYNSVQPASHLKAHYVRIVITPQNENCVLGISRESEGTYIVISSDRVLLFQKALKFI